MEQLKFNSLDEAKQAYNTGDTQKDLEVINAIINGNVVIEENSQEETINTTETTETTMIPETPVVDFVQEELERQRNYTQMIEKRRQEEKEELLRKNKEIEDNLERERRNREELEKKLQELSQLKRETVQSSQPSLETEDEEFVSEYTKKTRQMVEELKNSVGSDNPIVKQLSEEVSRIRQDYEKEQAERKRFQEEKAKKENQEKVYNNIRQFLNQHPELKPQKDISEINHEYENFRKDLAYVSGAKSYEELERYIEEYKRNGPIKEIADKNGIKPVQELDKYDFIVDLMDFQSGVKYDTTLGKHVPILDDQGIQVRYGSLDEAYNIRNYYDNLTNQRRQAYREVAKKMEQFSNSPVIIPEDRTSTFHTGLTLDQEKQVLNMDPREWINNPEKRKLVETVYSKHGLEIPRYRGRK